MKKLLFVLPFVFAATGHAASSIGALEPAAATIKTGETVQFKLNGDFDGALCGLVVNFADGGKLQEIRVRDKEKFPLSFPRTFTKAGTYKVVAEGGRVGAALGCLGTSSATITVVDPPPVTAKAAIAAPAGAAAVACPAGYSVVAASVKASTGEFACTPNKPAKPIDCAAGLKYYEKGATVGCRK
jgi:hypothetical protein